MSTKNNNDNDVKKGGVKVVKEHKCLKNFDLPSRTSRDEKNDRKK